MTLIIAKSDYIEKANTILFNLREYEEAFEKQAKVLNYTKCVLLRNEDLDDFYVDGIYVSVYNNSSGYDLFFDDYKMVIDVDDKLILDYKLIKN